MRFMTSKMKGQTNLSSRATLFWRRSISMRSVPDLERNDFDVYQECLVGD